MSGYERRYSRGGRVAHLVTRTMYGELRAACGVFGTWYGTGSQDEYEKAAALPVCKNCKGLRTR